MAERKRDQYAPIKNQRQWNRFQSQVESFRKDLFERYRDSHADWREREMERNNDGIAWRGPAKFVLPVDLVAQTIPNMRVLNAVAGALTNIVEWPNARGQAYQLGRCVKFGAEAGCHKEIAQIGDLVAKIAREKPYGEKTVGFTLIRVDWNTIWFEGNFGVGSDMKDLLTGITRDLTSFRKGEYFGCLPDYPFGPFWRLRGLVEVTSFSSPEEKEAYVGQLIRDRYPILAERPALAKRLLKKFSLSTAI